VLFAKGNTKDFNQVPVMQPTPAASIPPRVSASPSTQAKKTTITCVKGKLTKKVTAVKPICPSGYKKK